MSFAVTVSAGAPVLPGGSPPERLRVVMPNPRAEDTAFEAAFTGGHLLHLAVAACVLNDLYREAERVGIPLHAVSVTADGGWSGDPVVSTGIAYAVRVESPAGDDEVARLIELVDEIAEIPNSLRDGTAVELVRWPDPA